MRGCFCPFFRPLTSLLGEAIGMALLITRKPGLLDPSVGRLRPRPSQSNDRFDVGPMGHNRQNQYSVQYIYAVYTSRRIRAVTCIPPAS